MSEEIERTNYAKQAPDMFRAMAAFGQAAAKGLDPVVAELVKIRASQINRCAFCLDMHITAARKAGETDERLNLLPAWAEVRGVYTDKERAALALTEAITLLTASPAQAGSSAGEFVPDELYARAAAHFDEAELSRLVGTITAINAWNRFNVTFHLQPGGLA